MCNLLSSHEATCLRNCLKALGIFEVLLLKDLDKTNSEQSSIDDKELKDKCKYMITKELNMDLFY